MNGIQNGITNYSITIAVAAWGFFWPFEKIVLMAVRFRMTFLRHLGEKKCNAAYLVAFAEHNIPALI